MRKILIVVFCSILTLCFIANAAASDIDLSNMSFEELLKLQQDVNLAIFNSEKWKEVEVPMGIWDVGKDIPAGRWEISRGPKANPYLSVSVAYYLERSSDGQPNKYRETFRLSEGESVVLELADGNVLKIEDSSVIFKRYVPSFSFD